MNDIPPKLYILLNKDAFCDLLCFFKSRRDALKHEFDGALIERHRPLLDELERDIKIALSRICRHEKKDDWAPVACNQLISELRFSNSECQRKVTMLAKIFPNQRRAC